MMIRGVAWAGMLAISIAGACGFEESFDGPCVPQAWNEEAEALPAPGVPVSFALTASSVQVDAASKPRVDAATGPFRLTVDGYGDVGRVAFADAELADGRRGLLIADASGLRNASAEAEDLGEVELELGAEGPILRLAVLDEAPVLPDLGPEADPADRAALDTAFEYGGRWHDLEIAGAARLIRDGVAEPLEVGDIVVAAEGMLSPPGTRLWTSSVDAEWSGDVRITLTAAGGQTSLPGPELPRAIVGRDAHLHVGAYELATIEDMVVRQAFAPAPLLPADVELRLCEASTLHFERGQSRVLRFAMRERGGHSDAELDRIEVTGPDGLTFPLRVTVDRSVPSALADLGLEDPPPASGGGGTGSQVGETITCIFTLGFVCDPGGSHDPPPDPPAPLATVPRFLEPGAIRQFEIEVTAFDHDDDLPVEFHVVGLDYDAVATAEIRIGEDRGLFR